MLLETNENLKILKAARNPLKKAQRQRQKQKQKLQVFYSIQNFSVTIDVMNHGLRTPNEGINQRNLKIWADVADKICFGRT